MTRQATIPLRAVDAYRADVPPTSPEWATTDRGWVYDLAHPDRGNYLGNLPVGNYLRYPGRGVHACATPWTEVRSTGAVSRGATSARWFDSVEEAVEWIWGEWSER